MFLGERSFDPALLVPGLDATRWDYARIVQANDELERSAGDVPQMAADLTRFIFETHPDILDLPPHVRWRFQESRRVMDRFPDGREQLTESILGHYQTAAAHLEKGYAHAVTATILSADPTRPAPQQKDGLYVQPISIPERVQERALRWNNWMQTEIKERHITDAFDGHPQWVGVKLADGSWLQAGNLMFEAAEGVARLRMRTSQSLEERWGIDRGAEWGAGLDSWYLMTHIVDKELLRLADSLGPNMIDSLKLTTESYVRSYEDMLKVIEANPQLDIKGLLSDGTWIYSDELTQLFPHQAVSKLHDVAGDVVNIGTARELNMPAQATFATHDPERAAAAQAGSYQVTIAARYMAPAAMRAQLDTLGSRS